MAYKSRRAARYKGLQDIGLLGFEARGLSQLSWAELRFTPYIQDFLKMRKAWSERVEDKGQYTQEIMEWYRGRNWTKRQGWYQIGDVWKWIRELEKVWKRKHPEYETPVGRMGKKKKKKYVQWY